MSLPPVPPQTLKAGATKPATRGTAPSARKPMSATKADAAKGPGPKSKSSGPPRPWTLSDCQGFWYIYAPHWEARTAGLIVALENTFVKRTTAYSWELPEWEKREVKRGGELRIDGAPVLVEDAKEKNRHKWTHLHRRVHLGEIERCKAELLDARVKLIESQKRLQKEREDEQALVHAKKQLAAAKASVEEEMSLRKKLGLSMDIDPFDDAFSTKPAPGGAAAATLPTPAAAQAVAAAAESKAATPVAVRHYVARGSVQGVCFRMTLAKAAIKRGVEAGATNDKDGLTVSITLQGPASALDGLEQDLRTVSPLNSMGAKVDTLDRMESGTPLDEHTVNTANVEDIEWAEIERFL